MIYMMFYHALRSSMEAKVFTHRVIRNLRMHTGIQASSYITSLRENEAHIYIYIYLRHNN